MDQPFGIAKAEGVENPFFVPYETSVEMWHVEK